MKIFGLFVAFTLICFAFSPIARAVVPAPDGGYPGQNTAEGQSALLHLAGGTFNTALGWSSLGFNVTGSFNTAIGAGTLLANTADENTATGAGALLSNNVGRQNTADGAFALFNNTTGEFNTAVGLGALFSNTTGIGNTANGWNALQGNTIGVNNTAIGELALDLNTTGNNNIALGAYAGEGITTASNVICIGANGNNVNDSCFIGNIRGVTTQNADAVPVLIDSTGQLGTMSSSRRFKKEIKPMDQTSETILGLKPVTFHYNTDKTNTPQFGLIAEEVAEVSPDLVVRDGNGEIYTVRYDAVNAMLLNEFLKEHKKIEEQQATIAELKLTVAQQQKGFESKLTKQEKQIEALTAGLQKVSTQLELSKAAPQTAENTQ